MDFTMSALPVRLRWRPVSSQSCVVELPMSVCSSRTLPPLLSLPRMPKPKSTSVMKWASRRVDPDLAGDAAQDVAFEVGWVEARVGGEAEAIALAGGAGDDSFDAIEEGLGEQRQEVVDAGGVALLALVAVLLEVGMGGEGVEAIELGAVGVGGERLAVDGDEAGYVAVAGLDDLLGGVVGDAVALLGFVQEVAEREVVGVGLGTVGDGATDQSGGVDGGALRRGRRRGQKRDKEEGREAVHADRIRQRVECGLAALDAHSCAVRLRMNGAPRLGFSCGGEPNTGISPLRGGR
jgi:hypothetical protein